MFSKSENANGRCFNEIQIMLSLRSYIDVYPNIIIYILAYTSIINPHLFINNFML